MVLMCNQRVDGGPFIYKVLPGLLGGLHATCVAASSWALLSAGALAADIHCRFSSNTADLAATGNAW